MTLVQLYYVSETAQPNAAEIDEAILKSARERNPRNNVTGFLLRTPTRFGQFLEGPEAGVLTIFSHIKSDPRHRDLRYRIRRNVEDRGFPNWSMGYGKCSDILAASLVTNLPDSDSEFHHLIAQLQTIAREKAQQT